MKIVSKRKAALPDNYSQPWKFQ